MKDDDGDGQVMCSTRRRFGRNGCDDDLSGGAEVNPAQTEHCGTEHDGNRNDITNEKMPLLVALSGT